jgi:hypothetical protein
VIPTQQIFRHFTIGRHGKVPDCSTIKKWVQRFRITTSATNKKPKGRVRILRTPRNIEGVGAALGRSPKVSARTYSVSLNISSRYFIRVYFFHPYQLHVVRQLSHGAFASVSAFCEQRVIFVNEYSDVIRQLIMSDKAHFSPPGWVNKLNRTKANPNELHVKPLSSQKVTVWFGILTFGIIGPYFSRKKEAVQLLWHLTFMSIELMSSCFQTYAVVTSTLPPSGSKNREQQHILLGNRWTP